MAASTSRTVPLWVVLITVLVGLLGGAAAILNIRYPETLESIPFGQDVSAWMGDHLVIPAVFLLAVVFHNRLVYVLAWIMALLWASADLYSSLYADVEPQASEALVPMGFIIVGLIVLGSLVGRTHYPATKSST